MLFVCFGVYVPVQKGVNRANVFFVGPVFLFRTVGHEIFESLVKVL